MTNPNSNTLEVDEEVYYGVGTFLWEVIKVFLWAMIIIIPIRVFLFQPFFVQGSSMEPNFKDSDYLIVNEFGYKITNVLDDFGFPHVFTVGTFREFSRGDVVVFRYPRDPSQFFIKRVIGVPGEKVKIEGNKITIFNDKNPEGMVLDESSYLASTVITNGAVTTELKNDDYFVLGDNRQFSHDSRAWGVLPKSDVIGKVLIRAWPFSKAEIL